MPGTERLSNPSSSPTGRKSFSKAEGNIARPAYSYRDDPDVPDFADDRPLIVFDGHCVMCSGWAEFIIRHDPDKRFRLMAAQTPLGTALYKHFNLDPVDYETNLLIIDGVGRFKADGALTMLDVLGIWKPLVWLARRLPVRFLDPCYEFVARNRYRLFGMRESCYLPGPEDRDRFLS